MSSDFRKLVDRALKVQTRVFGEEVKFYPKDGGVKKINAVFDNAFTAIDPDTEQVISGNQSILGVNLNDINGNEIHRGELFEVRGTRYRVIDVQEDGQGGASVLIQKVNSDEKTDIRKYPRRNR